MPLIEVCAGSAVRGAMDGYQKQVTSMPSATIVKPVPPLYDEARLAVAGFLARYSTPIRRSYACDLRQFFAWCASVQLQIFDLKRGPSSCGRGPWRSAAWRAPPSVGGCRPSRVSTGSVSSTE